MREVGLLLERRGHGTQKPGVNMAPKHQGHKLFYSANRFFVEPLSMSVRGVQLPQKAGFNHHWFDDSNSLLFSTLQRGLAIRAAQKYYNSETKTSTNGVGRW